jgi:hypothetical protein
VYINGLQRAEHLKDRLSPIRQASVLTGKLAASTIMQKSEHEGFPL